jgi:hypothetical protein
MANPPGNGPPLPHHAGIAPSVPKGTPDPCRHRRNAKTKKQVFVVYKAKQIGSRPPKYYIGRTRGPSVDAARNARERGHHRADIGPLVVVCVQNTYSACRGAEQKHYQDLVDRGEAIITKRSKGRGAQIAPIRDESSAPGCDYLECAKESAKKAKKPCKICSK